MTRFAWRSLAGLGVWAVMFCAVYGLHGIGCAVGWPARDGLAGLSLHLTAMVAMLGLGVIVHLALWPWTRPSDMGPAPGPWASLPRWGAWIGLAATILTLGPLFVTTSCGA